MHADPPPLATCAVTMYCAMSVLPPLVGKDRTNRLTSGESGFGDALRRSSCGGHNERTGGSPIVIARPATGGCLKGGVPRRTCRRGHRQYREDALRPNASRGPSAL